MSGHTDEAVIHIYSASLQLATAFVDDCGEVEMRSGYAPDKMIFCDSCDECWPASQMIVQCYYDGRRFWCANGHGCKDKARMEAHRERSRLRRSHSARMAWLDRKERAAATGEPA